MIKTIYICDHCKKECVDEKDGTIIDFDHFLCAECSIKLHFLCENQARVRKEFFNEKGFPFITDPLNGDIIHPSDLRTLTQQETKKQVYLNLYKICGTDGLSAKDIFDIAKDDGIDLDKI